MDGQDSCRFKQILQLNEPFSGINVFASYASVYKNVPHMTSCQNQSELSSPMRKIPLKSILINYGTVY